MKGRKHEALPRYDTAFNEGAEDFFSCLKYELLYLTSYTTLFVNAHPK